MEFVGALRVLWRYRVLVALSVIPAVAVVLVLAHGRYTVGNGAASALVDTYRSQTVDLGAQTGSDIQTLVARAALLSSVMTSSPIKDEIALSAGIRPDRLISVSTAAPGPPGAGATGGQVSAPSPKATTIRATVPELQSGAIPIIVVKTQAPTAAQAQRIADASFTALIAGIDTIAGNNSVAKPDRLVVRRLGAATATTVQKGPSIIAAAAAGVALFGLLCLLILGAYALVHGWRRAAALERGALEAQAEDADGLDATNGLGPDQSSLFDQAVPSNGTSNHVVTLEPAAGTEADQTPAERTQRHGELGAVHP